MQTPTKENNFKTGASGENDPGFRGADYYANKNNSFQLPQSDPTPGNIPVQTIPAIPADVALGNVKPIELPNKPISTAPSNATTNANSYISNLTGVKGIDTANSAIYNLMSSTLNNPELANKLSKANELKTKADLYNEEYRKKAEEARVNPMLGAETLNSRLGALERERAFTAGTLAIEAAAANQDYTSLKSLLNDQMQIELEPLKFNRDFASDMYKRTQDQAFQRQMKAEDRAYEAKKAQLELENEAKLYGMTGKLPALPTGQPDIAKKIALTLKLSKKDVPGAEAALGVINSLQKIATENQDGKFIGLAPIRLAGNLRGSESRSKLVANRSDIEAINLKVQQWASGASLTNEQTKQVAKLVPDKNDSDFKVREKINNLTDFMQNQLQATLATKGVYYQPETIDWFADPVDSYVDNSIKKATDPYEDYLMQIQTQVK